MTEPTDIVDLLLHEHIKGLGVVPALLMADAAEEIRKLRARLSAPLPGEIAGLIERLRERAASYRLGGPSSEHTAVMLEESASALEQMARENAILSDRELITHDGEPVVTSNAALQEILYMRDRIETLEEEARNQAFELASVLKKSTARIRELEAERAQVW